jgi:hypothetical protein
MAVGVFGILYAPYVLGLPGVAVLLAGYGLAKPAFDRYASAR